jgi:hypothetical protein
MDPRYPVGKADPNDPTPLPEAIEIIASLPRNLRNAVGRLTPAQIDASYREGGWTARQVVHHLADSHVNSYTRFRLALTEPSPSIKPYDEKAWAELPDAKSGPIDPSLALLDGLHARWAALLRSMTAADFARTFEHPERGMTTLEMTTRLYAWHCRHHLAHVALCGTRG